METFIAGDVGGTNTRLSLFAIHPNDRVLKQKLEIGKLPPGQLMLDRKYLNESFSSFSEILRAFLKESNCPGVPVSACIAFAGPVKNNTAKLTNRAGWEICGNKLQEEFGIKTVLIVNDFLAVGYGLLTLNEATDCVCLHAADKDPTAPIACIGAGTGLGECFLTPEQGSYRCFPTEGGHAEFAPRNDLETELLAFLKQKFQQKHRVSVERVVSGIGLANVYEFLSSKFPEKVDLVTHHKIENAGEMRGAVIANNSANCELCRKTMEIFATAYGSEAGVAALKWMPFGGLYLTGGLTPKNIELIRQPEGPFLKALFDKGRVSGMIYSVPIYAVIVDNVGERGAHYVAYQEYQRQKQQQQQLQVPVAGGAVSQAVVADKCLCSKDNVVAFAVAALMLAAGVFCKKHV